MILSPLAKFTFLLAVRKLGGTAVMNIHVGEFPVNQSRRGKGESMSPVVHRAGEGMCAKLRPGHSNSFAVFHFASIFISRSLSATKFLFHIGHSQP